MRSLRRRLRLCAAAWIAFQVGSFSAFMPWACCIAPEPARQTDAAKPACHEAPSAPATAHDVDDRCAMRSGCNSPLAAILALLSNQGPLAPRAAASPDLQTGSLRLSSADVPLGRPAPPDLPPPRA
jgi:hypothetical protein